MIGQVSFSVFVNSCAFLLLNIVSRHTLFADNLALLSGTLRTFQKAACDDQIVTLRCPPTTFISVELAQYGNTASPSAATLCRHHSDLSNHTCVWPNALQYSLLQTVVEACQKKQQCKFHTSPKTFGGDPCPGVHKYVEIAYKCRPDVFRSKVACQNDVLQLKCNPPTTVAIYSASFGRTEYESVRCPQPQGVREETCLVSYATETVIQICHGKSQCTLSADTATFGNPCHKDSRMYLKVVFTCVPRKVLREPYDNRIEEDNADGDIIEDPDYDIDYDTVGDTVIYRDRGGDNSYSPSPKLSAPNISGNTSLLQPPPSRVSPPPPLNELASKENQEKLILYLILSIGGGLLSILTLVIGRLLWQRHTTNQRAKYHASAGTTTLPNGFADDISEIDADIGLTSVNSPSVTMIVPSQVPAHHHSHSHSHSPSEVVRYGGGESNAPRSLSRSGNSQYYYG